MKMRDCPSECGTVDTYVNGSIIGESDKVKYLGHIICNDMSDDDDNYDETKTTIRLGFTMFYCLWTTVHVFVSSMSEIKGYI